MAHKWDRSYLTTLGSDLSKAGFSTITIKLPIDLDKVLKDKPVEEQVADELQRREIPLQNFLDRERNYSAVILVAKKEDPQETIKILFGNKSEKTAFADSTFPSGHSSRSTLYVQSSDPARVYPLCDFFHDHLSKKGDSTVLRTVAGLLSLFLVILEFITLLANSKGIIQTQWTSTAHFDVFVSVLAFYFMYHYLSTPTGLSVNDRETETLGSYVRRALKGELRDNPVVNLVISVIATVIAALILHWIGLP